MIRKSLLGAVTALSLLSASTAMAAGSASALSLAPAVRASANVEDANSLGGGLALLGLLGLGVLALFVFVANDDDEATSP